MGARKPEAPKAFPWAPKISDYDYHIGLGITSIPISSEFGLTS